MNSDNVAFASGMERPDIADALALRAAGGGHRIAIVLRHADDPAVALALGVWAELSGASQLSPFMCVEQRSFAEDDPAPLDLGRSTSLLNDGAWTPVGLMYTLHGLGELSRLDIVTVCTASLDQAQQAELAQADVMLRQDLQRVMPDATPVSSHRVWIPRYGDAVMAPDAAFASPEASSALVVLPVDRQFERAAAMPVSGAGRDDVYAWHVAVETASLGGLWSTMDGAPLEFIETAASGVGRPLVRLVRSMCRAARIHTPAPEQSLDGTGLLPLTPGLLPAPEPTYMIRAAAPHIYPSTFRVLTDVQDDIGSGSRAGEADFTAPSSVLRGLIPLSEAAHVRRLAVETIDSVLRRGNDAAEAASQLDDYIADTVEFAPWTAPLARDVAADAGNTSPGAAEEARVLLESTRAPVSIEAVPAQGWEELLDGVFGMADATHASEGIRAAVASARYVVIDPVALAPDAEALIAAISVLNGDEHRHADDPTEEAEQAVEQRDDLDQQDQASLLTEVTGQFDVEIERSERDVERRIGLLRARMRHENRPEPGVTSFVAYALLASVLIGAGSLLTLTGLREMVTPDRLSEQARVASFLLLALAATLPPVLRLTPSRSWSAQVRLTLVAAAYGGGVAVVIVAAPAIEESALDRPGQWLPAGAVVLIVMSLAIAAWIRGFTGDRGLLGPLAVLVGDRTAGAVPFAYAFVMAVAVLNFDQTAPSVFENRNWRLLTVLLAVAVAAAIAAGGLVRLVRRRDRRQVSEWRQSIDELVDGCELGSARTAALEILKAHWLTTASVAARLVHRPFGTHRAAAVSNDPMPAVRKLLMFDLELTDETRDAYLGELLPELASSGWLREQYRRMSSQFVSSERSRFGIGADDYMPPPEHCTYPMSLQSVMSAEGSGPRWRFAERVYAGDFDSVLYGAAEDALIRAMAATFMSEQIAVSLGPADSGRQTLPQLLGELLPSGEARLPSGTLPPSTESPPEYQSLVWWPQAVSMPPESAPTPYQCRHLREQGTILFHAVRVDISEPVGMERVTPISEPDVTNRVGAGDPAMRGSTGAPADPLM
ncbi:MAG: hypothetical protein F4Y41_17645 [Gammaproteobacteria bacterium]|nr:hypothetical protein [Gammaproteobacteria bacterium]